jgi:hypothetical protein
MTRAEKKEFKRQLQVEGHTGSVRLQNQLVGSVSPDGLRWTRLSKPLLEPPGNLDGLNMLYYDEDRRAYVALMRGHQERRRTVRKSTSGSFATGWTQPRTIFMADTQDDPDIDIYTFPYCRRPGGGYHLAFPSAYHRATDIIDIHLAVSRDGECWSRPDRSTVIPRDIPGQPGCKYGCMYASPGLIRVRGDRWGLTYVGHRRCHNDYDWEALEERKDEVGCHWAIWDPDRIVGLEAPVKGEVTLIGRICAGRELLLNLRTFDDGYIQTELFGGIGAGGSRVAPPIEGFTFADCDPLRGDLPAGVVSWRGNSDLSHLAGQGAMVRLRLVKAKVFAFAI